MKVAAFGRTQWLYDSVIALGAAGHDVVLIGTCPAAPEYTVSEHDFARLASDLGVPFFCDVSINREEYVSLARSSGAQIAISVNWPTLIGAPMREVLEHGVINAHAGDLPRYRGNACPNWAILTGESSVVLTLHRMVDQLDAGPVFLKKALLMTERTYISDVYKFLDRAIPCAYVDVVAGLESGTLRPEEQSDLPGHSLRCYPRIPDDGEIDWREPAKSLDRLVRASAEPFPGAFSFVGDVRLTVWRAHAGVVDNPVLGVPGHVVLVDANTGEVCVLAGAGVLVLEEVEIAGVRGKAANLIRSTRTRMGGRSTPKYLEELSRRVELLEEQVALMQGERR